MLFISNFAGYKNEVQKFTMNKILLAAIISIGFYSTALSAAGSGKADINKNLPPAVMMHHFALNERQHAVSAAETEQSYLEECNEKK